MKRAFEVISSTVFPPRCRLSVPVWTQRNVSISLHFLIDLPAKMASFTWSQNQFPCNFHPWSLIQHRASLILPSTVKPWTGITSLRRGMFLLVLVLLGLHIPNSFGSQGNLLLALGLITLSILSMRCWETCHTSCWQWKAQCPQHMMCQSNSTAHTRRR